VSSVNEDEFSTPLEM